MVWLFHLMRLVHRLPLITLCQFSFKDIPKDQCKYWQGYREMLCNVFNITWNFNIPVPFVIPLYNRHWYINQNCYVNIIMCSSSTYWCPHCWGTGHPYGLHGERAITHHAGPVRVSGRLCCGSWWLCAHSS
jgi:hypothetical protein